MKDSGSAELGTLEGVENDGILGRWEWSQQEGHANELGVVGAGEALRSPRFMAKTMVMSTVKGGLQEGEWPGGWVGVPQGWCSLVRTGGQAGQSCLFCGARD